MLEIVRVVIEGTVLFPGVELVSVVHHLFVQSVEHFMRDHIVDDDETIMVQAPYSNL